MAVGSPVGPASMVWNVAGVQSPSWPTGTTTGHTVFARCSNMSIKGAKGPRQAGWNSAGGDIWWRRLDAAALAAGPGTWDGQLLGLMSLPGARGVGGKSTYRGTRLTEPGSAMLVYGWSERWSDDPVEYPSSGMMGSSIEIYAEQWVAWWLRTYADAGTPRIERDADAEGYMAFAILPAKVPDPPLLSSPAAGEHLDVANAVTVEALHQSTSGMLQEARRVRVKLISSGTWSYVTDAGAIDAAVQTVSTSGSIQAIAAGALAAGAYETQAATAEAGGWSDWSPSRQFVLEVAPTNTPTLTTALNDLTPGGSWTRTTPGGTQIAWQAAIVPQGGGLGDALHVTPVYSGSGSAWSVPALSWVKNGWCELLLRIQQTGGLWSTWARSAAKQITWTAPNAVASVTVVDASPLEVRVAGIPAGSLALSVEWAPQLADEWLPYAMEVGLVDSATILVPLAPYEVARRYRVCSWEAIDGVWLPSAWVTSTAVASSDTSAYLVGDEPASEWLRVRVINDGPRELVQGVTVSYGLGSDRPMVARTETAGQSGTTVLQVWTAAELDALVEWVTLRDAWWFRWPPERGPEGLTLRDAQVVRMTQAGAAGWARRIQVNNELRELTLKWVEQ